MKKNPIEANPSEQPQTSAEEYKEKCNEVVRGYYEKSHSFNDIFSRTGLVAKDELEKIDEEDHKAPTSPTKTNKPFFSLFSSSSASKYQYSEQQDQKKLSTKAKFDLVKKNADEKLTQTVSVLKLDGIDQQLADVIEISSAHTSLKLGIAQFKLKDADGIDQQLESFNYSGKGEVPKSDILIRDARAQNELGDSVNKVAGSTPDTHIAVMAGRIRGAIALIDNSTMAKEDKDKAKQSCIDLFQASVRTLQDTKIPATEKKAVKHFSKIVQTSNNLLIETLEKQNIKIQDQDQPLKGKKLLNALATARDFAMMKTSRDHCHVTTIHRSVEEGKENGFSISAIADPISKQLRGEYKNIKDFQDIKNGELPSWYENSGQKAKEEIKKNLLPQWYKEKTLLEQKMIAQNIDNYLSGKCVLSSQDRKTVGIANFWAQIEGVINNSGEVTNSFISTRGTWGARTDNPTEEDQRIATENAKHIAKAFDGKVLFQNVASNSIFGKSAERVMHNSMRAAVKKLNEEEGKELTLHTNPLNLLRLIERKSSLQKVEQHAEEAQQNKIGEHTNCMSSKDRTSLAIIISTMKILYANAANKTEAFSAMMSAKHNEFLASMPGGTSGATSVKLSDSMKVTWGLGMFGEMMKKEVDINSSLAKANKVKSKNNKEKEMDFQLKTNLANVKEAREAREAREEHKTKLAPVLKKIEENLKSHSTSSSPEEAILKRKGKDRQL